MAQLIKPAKITTETSNGEVTINLVLTIKVEGGEVSVSASHKKEEEKIDFIIPDTESLAPIEMIDFGKQT